MSKLSIVVPMYNAEKYITRLMSSVLSSEENFELICIDDGSTDKSGDIVNTIADTRLKVYHKINEGPLKTWLYGLERSTGEYVTFLDADDYIDTEGIGHIIHFIEKVQADMMCTPYYIENRKGVKRWNKLPISDGLYGWGELDRIRAVLTGGTMPYSKCTKVIKKKFLMDFAENIKTNPVNDFEDWLAMIYIFSQIKSVYILNKPYYHYIQHGSSISKSNCSYCKNLESLRYVIECLANCRADNINLDSVLFYGEKSILYRATKIHDTSTIIEILHDNEFREFLYKKSKLTFFERILLYPRNVKWMYLCYFIRSAIKK